MAQHWSEGVGTLRFTGREYQQELIDIGLTDNLLACPPEQAANFIALKLLQEMAYQIRPPNKKKSIFVTQPRKLKSLESELRQLTDLHIVSINHCDYSDGEMALLLQNNQVLVVVSAVLDVMLMKRYLDISLINLLIIDECHSVMSDKRLQQVMSIYSKHKAMETNVENIPRIIALSYPLFTGNSPSDYYNNIDSVENIIKRDYDDFINNRSEFYNQWNCDNFILESNDSNACNTPLKSSQSSECCTVNHSIHKEYCHDSLNHFLQPVIVDEEKSEDYQKMTDFNYWRMSYSSIDVPEVKKEKERLSVYDKLEYQLEKLENMLCCKADMAADVVGLKKITGKPREVLLESTDTAADSFLCDKGRLLKHYMKRTVFNALQFLDDHRYDPMEIYGDDAFGDELRAIPNPIVEPRDLLLKFLHVLDQAGPYSADKAAFILLVKIEKLKVKIPYERHFLLFCLVTSVLLQVRSAAEIVFEKYQTETEKIKRFTSPKILRLMHIFKLFKPKAQDNVEGGNVKNCNNMYKKLDSDDGVTKHFHSHNPGYVGNSRDDVLDVCDKTDATSVENNVSDIVLNNDTNNVYMDETTCEDRNTPDVPNTKCDNISSQIDSSQQGTYLVAQLDCCDFKLLKHKSQQHTDNKSGHEVIHIPSPSKIINNWEKTEHDTKSDTNSTETIKLLKSDAQNSCTTNNTNSIKEEIAAECINGGKNSLTVAHHLRCRNKVERENDCVVVDDVCYTKGAFHTLHSCTSDSCKRKEDLLEGEGNMRHKEKQLPIGCILQKDSETQDLSFNVKQSVEFDSCKFSTKKRYESGKKSRKGEQRNHNWNDPEALCGLIFVDEPLMAKILYSLIYEYSRQDPELQFINAQFTVDKTADPQTEPKEAENEHRLQEEVLRRFRTHECNLLIGTSVLEDGMDLPKCNLVIRWDSPRGYRSYAQCRSRARAPKSLYALMGPLQPEKLVTALAHYTYIERMLVGKCRWSEPGPMEEARASEFSPLILPYRPHQQAVTLSQAVQLVNRYCAKLPSDTFTRLVPLWTIEEIVYRGHTLYVCSVRLPINSPLKYQIVGHPMPSKVLARRVAALQVCRALHMSGELDNNLLPIGKESFRALEPDWVNMLPATDNMLMSADSHEPRPGTTKRKQYYYKKIAKSLSDCRPILGQPCLAYEIRAHLAVPLPERHNTRGRKLHPPENYSQGFCILTNRPIHQIPVFPLFTRSGEVRVELVKMDTQVVLNKRRSRLVHRFMKYTFKEVLRVHNHLMVFNPSKGNKNNYYIAPTIKVKNPDGSITVSVDWDFLQVIYQHTDNNKKQPLPTVQLPRSMKPNKNITNHNVKEKGVGVGEVERNTNETDLTGGVNGSSQVLVIDTIENNCKLIKLEDLGEDMIEDSWKEHEGKVSSVKWDELDETADDCFDNNKKISISVEDLSSVEEMPNPYLSPGEVFQFDYEKFRDAVVMPWYRNQSQPQYFYVAEVCWHLTPQSAFPSSVHPSFMHYYNTKYGVTITQIKQPLLDVDHTSARLNLLTPRFVNRKGVALPTSSERTKRAKRELLEQKQILVPELCSTHPFRGALWRAAVALPCVLYRINSLLLADEIRRSVAVRVSLGKAYPSLDFSWPPLDFGWSLADVLKEKEKTEMIQEKDLSSEQVMSVNVSEDLRKSDTECSGGGGQVEVNQEEDGEQKEIIPNEISVATDPSNETGDMFEVGTWTNEMASTMVSGRKEEDIFSSNSGDTPPHHRKYSVADSDTSFISSDMDLSGDETDSQDDTQVEEATQRQPEKGGIRIEFKSGNEAEAIDIPACIEEVDPEDQHHLEVRRLEEKASKMAFNEFFYAQDKGDDNPEMKKYIEIYQKAIWANEQDIVKNGTLIKYTEPLTNIKLNDYSENIPFHTPKHYRQINKHMLRNKQCLVDDSGDQLQSQECQAATVKEDHTNPFPDIYDKALSKCEIIHLFQDMFPYEILPSDQDFESNTSGHNLLKNGAIDLEDLENNKRMILNEIKGSMPREEWRKYNFFAMKDFHKDDTFEADYEDVRRKSIELKNNAKVPRCQESTNPVVESEKTFSFDYQPDLKTHPGPSPSVILQALTMSNANDGINLERLETVGDSFLKYAITVYLYCSYPNIHEGKLSYLRSKQVSNLNLYRLGKRRHLGGRMVACKFEPHDNWLPPCHKVPAHLERALIHTHIPSSLWNVADMPSLNKMSREEVEKLVYERVMQQHTGPPASSNSTPTPTQCPIHSIHQSLDKDCNSIASGASKSPSILNKEVQVQTSAKAVSSIDSEEPLENVTDCLCHSVRKEESLPKEGDSSPEQVPCFVPYNLITQHSIPDKSIADCVEALIGAYLIECGPRGALLFMAWLGIRVLPKREIILHPNHLFIKSMNEAQIKKKKDKDEETVVINKTDKQINECSKNVIKDNCDHNDKSSKRICDVDTDDDYSDTISNCSDDTEQEQDEDDSSSGSCDEGSDCSEVDSDVEDVWFKQDREPGCLMPYQNKDGKWVQVIFGQLEPPPSPLLRFVPDPEGELMQMLSGYEELERTLNYRFRDRCYLLQAMTHASHTHNRLTDCYQRLEFLGDAVLDYLITRQLYEDPRRHSPGPLTDLRSALVNNTIFASLAVRHGMHKFFRHLSPGLNEVLARFVKIQEENGHSISEEHYLIQEDECEQAEDVEVPKALGDLFESVAGAIFLDSGMSLDAVWKVYYTLMHKEMELFSETVPKSPVRELLEMEPETTKFGKPEKLADGRRVRVTVEVLGVGAFKGVGRNFRIAKCTAAKCALRHLSVLRGKTGAARGSSKVKK